MWQGQSRAGCTLVVDMARRYPIGDLKILWALAAGRCSYPGCTEICIVPGLGAGGPAVVGDVAHIIAHAPGGPRSNPDLPSEYLDSYENWILLCPNHHRLVDAQPEHFDAQTLHEWKRCHEAWIADQLAGMAPSLEFQARTTRTVLYRIAREAEDAWAAKPRGYVGSRFDDPREGYPVVYAADSPEAALAEATAWMEPAAGLLERMSAFFGETVTEQSLGIDRNKTAREFFRGRILAKAQVRGRFADITDPSVRRYVEGRIAPIIGAKTGETSEFADSRWTQQASRALYETQAWDGICFPSRYLRGHVSYALFGSAEITKEGTSAIDQ